MLVLILCFLTCGVFAIVAPYIEYTGTDKTFELRSRTANADGWTPCVADDVLQMMCQTTIFVAILSSFVLETNPNDPVISVVLPALFITPILFACAFAGSGLKWQWQRQCFGHESTMRKCLTFIGRCQQQLIVCMDHLCNVQSAKQENAAIMRQSVAIVAAHIVQQPADIDDQHGEAYTEEQPDDTHIVEQPDETHTDRHVSRDNATHEVGSNIMQLQPSTPSHLSHTNAPASLATADTVSVPPAPHTLATELRI